MTAAQQRVLVIGGTGPTGIPLVEGLVERGHAVAILHRGLHERDETPASVEHVHADPYDEDALRGALDRSHVRRGLRDVRPAARRRRGAAGPGGPVRLRRRGSRVPRLHESVAPRAERPAGAHRRGRAHRAGARGGREGLPHRAHGGARSSTSIPMPRTSATPTCTGRTSSCRASGSWCAGCSTAGAGSWWPTTGSRCTITATPRTSRTRCCSRSSNPTPPPARSSTSATKKC